jgi:hypothetical protein
LEIRIFSKKQSVFKEWVSDTSESLKLSFGIDMSHSRLRKVVKYDTDYQQVVALLLDNLPQIKDIFVHCVGISSFPYISWLEFVNLCTKWHIIGKILSNKTHRQQYLPNVSN